MTPGTIFLLKPFRGNGTRWLHFVVYTLRQVFYFHDNTYTQYIIITLSYRINNACVSYDVCTNIIIPVNVSNLRIALSRLPRMWVVRIQNSTNLPTQRRYSTSIWTLSNSSVEISIRPGTLQYYTLVGLMKRTRVVYLKCSYRFVPQCYKQSGKTRLPIPLT